MTKREWYFNPYHQRIDEAMATTPEAPAADTEWELYEVFVREKRGDHPAHVGSIHATDPEMALVLAKEQYARRGRVVQLWVVPARYITATPLQDADVFEHVTDRSYREAHGYKVAKKIRAIRERREQHHTDEVNVDEAGDAAEAHTDGAHTDEVNVGGADVAAEAHMDRTNGGEAVSAAGDGADSEMDSDKRRDTDRADTDGEQADA